MPRSDDTANTVERRYGASAAREWDLVLRHIDLTAGFSLLVVIVPEPDGAELCALALERHLAGSSKPLRRLEPSNPETLRRIALPMLSPPAEPEIGALWVSAVTPPAAAGFEDWHRAWRYALATLNQQRNPLRRHFACPVILVGAPWLVPVFRDAAPDLWPALARIVRIEPESGEPAVEFLGSPEDSELEQAADRPIAGSADLDVALDGIHRLRGVAGKEATLALLLERAGDALFDGRNFTAAEENYREAADFRLTTKNSVRAGILFQKLAQTSLEQQRIAEAEALLRQALDLKTQGNDTGLSRGLTLDFLGRVVRDQGRIAEAETLFRAALALIEPGNDTALVRGAIFHELGRAVRSLGRPAEAEALFRDAIALKEAGGDGPVSRGTSLDLLGRAILQQGRQEEAEALFRRALALKKQGGDSALSRGVTLDMLGRAVRNQGRAAEAEALFRQALEFAEEGGDSAISRGITFDMLGRAVLDQGKAAEAEALFRQALTLAEEGGDTALSRGVTLDMLGRAVLDQGKAVAAEALFREALALKEQGGDSALSRGITLDNLGRAVHDQGRAADAETLFRQARASQAASARRAREQQHGRPGWA